MNFAPIRASVSPETITKVTRLFNGSLSDITNELIQNSRRAGATQISVLASEEEGKLYLTFADDGCGIDDPARVIALGASGWNEQVSEREDPAGMGVFSLAGKDVTIVSRHASLDDAWMAFIPADGWTGDKDIPITLATREIGTSITFTFESQTLGAAEQAVKAAALYCPVPVFFNEEAMPQEDFLAGALYVEEWRGSRIGIFDGHAGYSARTVNFHGLTIRTKIFELSGGHNNTLHARIDIGSTPDLQLVLPARKEFVQNTAFEDLQRAAEVAIYRAIAEAGEHYLPYANWLRAKELGIILPEAKAMLHQWTASTAERNYLGDLVALTDQSIRVDGADAPFEQCFARVASDDLCHLVFTNTDYEGYSWYQKLRRLISPRFTVKKGVNSLIMEPTGEVQNGEPIRDGIVDSILLSYSILEPTTGQTIDREHSADVVTVLPDESWCNEIDESLVFFPAKQDLTSDSLAGLLYDCYFSSSDDSAADSWDTQSHYAKKECRARALRLLVTPDQALIENYREHLAYSNPIPEGKVLRIEKRPGQKLHLELVDDVATPEAIAEANGGHWSDHPAYGAEDWRYEVGNGDTRLGYWAWVADKLRQEEDDQPAASDPDAA